MLRLAPVKGKIIFDGIDILNDVSLEESRSAMSVIPQVPVLFSGTFRSNLDPSDLYTDDEIWMSLKKVQLASKISSYTEQLQSPIIEGGKNLSVGEKQLLCLARALLKNTKLLVIDEATANVDNETDKSIQNVLKTCFKNCSIVTVAHRIETILHSDKVIVLNKGKVIEFGTVKTLLQLRGEFFSLLNSLLKKR